jgi:hypothetical protein
VATGWRYPHSAIPAHRDRDPLAVHLEVGSAPVPPSCSSAAARRVVWVRLAKQGWMALYRRVCQRLCWSGRRGVRLSGAKPQAPVDAAGRVGGLRLACEPQRLWRVILYNPLCLAGVAAEFSARGNWITCDPPFQLLYLIRALRCAIVVAALCWVVPAYQVDIGRAAQNGLRHAPDAYVVASVLGSLLPAGVYARPTAPGYGARSAHSGRSSPACLLFRRAVYRLPGLFQAPGDRPRAFVLRKSATACRPAVYKVSGKHLARRRTVLIVGTDSMLSHRRGGPGLRVVWLRLAGYLKYQVDDEIATDCSCAGNRPGTACHCRAMPDREVVFAYAHPHIRWAG